MKYLPLLICASFLIAIPAMAQAPDESNNYFGARYNSTQEMLEDSTRRAEQRREEQRQEEILRNTRDIQREQERQKVEDRRRDQSR